MATTQSDVVASGPPSNGGHGRRRRTAVIAGVAAACAVAIAAPLALHGGHHTAAPAGAPPSAPQSPRVPAGAVTGDVDGDGLPDTVSLTRAGLLRVDLGSGTTVRQLLPGGTSLEGLVSVGPPGLDIVTSARGGDGAGSREWTVRHLHRRSIGSVRMRHHDTIGSSRDGTVAWVSGQTLYDGTLDDLQKGQDRVAVLARTWSLRQGDLAPSRAGVRCWDRSAGHPPATCAAGQDWTYDAGPHGDLPDLQPLGASWFRTATSPVVDGSDSWTLARATPPGPPEAPHMDLVLRSGGSTAQVLVPPGWVPVLRPSPVTPGGVHAVLISQEGGDSDTWRVYVDSDGRPVELRTDGPLALGGGFSHDGGTAYLSWVTRSGDLFTRVGTSVPGHYRVYEWDPTGGTAGSPPVLQARDLGIVCVDQLVGHYGTCAS